MHQLKNLHFTKETGREISIDIMKGLLTIGMIFAHTTLFFVNPKLFKEALIMDFFNSISFPGFLFCFGYVFGKRYLPKKIQELRKKIILKSALLLIAFYVSALSFRLIVDKRPLTGETLTPILSLSDLSEYSEFLLTFSLTLLLSLFLLKYLKGLVEKPRLFWATIIVLICTTLIPYEMVTNAWIGLFIGSEIGHPTPVIQYLPFFLLGIYFYRNSIGINYTLLPIAAILFGMTFVDIILSFRFPSRFPPSFFWIVQAFFPLYIYYISSGFISRYNNKLITRFLTLLGRNVLFILLLSNLTIFILKVTYLAEFFYLSSFRNTLITLVIILIIVPLTILKETAYNSLSKKFHRY